MWGNNLVQTSCLGCGIQPVRHDLVLSGVWVRPTLARRRVGRLAKSLFVENKLRIGFSQLKTIAPPFSLHVKKRQVLSVPLQPDFRSCRAGQEGATCYSLKACFLEVRRQTIATNSQRFGLVWSRRGELRYTSTVCREQTTQ